MIVIFSSTHTIHAPPHELLNGELVKAHETPDRAEIIHTALVKTNLGPIIPPHIFDMSAIQAVHDTDYLRFLEHIYTQWVAEGGSPLAVLPDTITTRHMHRRPTFPLALPGYYASDLSAPIVAGTYEAAVTSAHVALTGAALLIEGHQAVYALCRPPGHHANRDTYGGYSYLNNAAIAANYLCSQQRPAQVVILDIDYHHGNGTQQIFYERDDVLTVSIHADPAYEYPYFIGFDDERGKGAGEGYNLNISLAEGTTNIPYLEALDYALEAVAHFDPTYIIVATGVDTFEADPIGEFMLTSGVYPVIGQRIAALRRPTLLVQEGGYAVDALGNNVVGLLQGIIKQ
ncbi:MAG: histone deacetylase family protein [Chloroflexi bacterium AL-W]|nr:histone deacetylase family protein [Chloroflexi bacterium AL-N1]NOK65724.1 histone deacetylase family protein [Chloroflexi bacterium AL-N10]NOK74335.1 histone deacetylase family protein [Chloroflexi bacterium AL-N5]NOK80757.1 histone deacetylase family protein [Chloroflexi bacterium AL-W]NOK88593.1 histone deacetylase family protein [Chloroflexi bacterium AL-N15]